MAKINILDKSVYNKISAGEVVEKPASVVKELVENALDAGATKISIRIEDGGLGSITVSDNGSGIEKSELTKVFLPHSTSKISEAEDLFNIKSLGFRGEAMASIASISRVVLESAVEGESGYSIAVDGGSMGEIIPVSHAVGTTVTVKDLFYNTPARLKFMRKPKTEERDITAVVEHACFANPFVSFEYITESGVQLYTNGEGLNEALAVVYGDDILDNVLEINAEEYGMQLTGFISNTNYAKPTRSYQTFIVNGRVVSSVSLLTALNNSYTDYFVKRSYPLAVLCLKVKPQEIDVNVHPQKSEVRFEYQSKVFSFIQRNIKRCLEESLKSRVLVNELGGIISDEWTKPFSPDIPENEPTTTTLLSVKSGESIVENKSVGPISTAVTPKNESPISTDIDNTLNPSSDSVLESANDTNTDNSFSDFNPLKSNDSTTEYKEIASDFSPRTVIQQQRPSNAMFRSDEDSYTATSFIEEDIKEGVSFKIIGQLFSTYIILEYEDKAILIDQHAACEFVNYLRLKDQIEKSELVIQPLLIPYEFSISSSDDISDERLEQLKGIGFEIRRVSSSTFELLALPSILAEGDFESLVASFVSDEDYDLPIKERLMYTACHASIRGNTPLDNRGIEIFLKSVFKHGIYPKCPHGRPAYLIYTKKDIEKLFLRIV